MSKQIKWSKLKQDIARSLCTQIEKHNFDLAGKIFADITVTGNHQPNIELLKARVQDRVMSWDVRAVKRLRDLFPAAFPKHLQAGNLFIEHTDGGWIITASPSEPHHP